MKNNEKVKDILIKCEALLEGHFLLSSGRHSDKYCQCAKLLQYPDLAAEVIEVIKDQVKDIDIDVLVGPAMGGIIVSYELARQLGKKGIFTERRDGKMTLSRGFEINKGDKVLITEDVVTTGKSTMETVKVLESFGATVIGVACIVDRRAADSDFKLPVYSAYHINIDSYTQDECPLCKKGEPYVKPGSRNIK